MNDHNTFLVLENDVPIAQGYKEIPYHFTFDINFNDKKRPD